MTSLAWYFYSPGIRDQTILLYARKFLKSDEIILNVNLCKKKYDTFNPSYAGGLFHCCMLD